MPIKYIVDGQAFDNLEEAQEYEKQAVFRQELLQLLTLKLGDADKAHLVFLSIVKDFSFAEKLVRLIPKVIY